MSRVHAALVFSLLLASTVIGHEAGAAVLVANSSAGADSGNVLLVDPITGQQRVLARFVNPLGIALEDARTLLVADADANGGYGALFRLDLSSGAVTTASSGGYFLDPIGVTVTSDGSIYVLDSARYAIIRIEPSTGSQTMLSSGGLFRNPATLDLATDGQLLVTDVNAFGGSGGLIAVSPITGTQTELASHGLLVDPLCSAREPFGSYLVSDPNAIDDLGAVIRVGLGGAQSTLFHGGILQDPWGITVDADGSVYVIGRSSANYGEGLLLRIDPISGSPSVVSRGGHLGFAFTLKVWNEEPVSARSTTWGSLKDVYRK